MSNKLAEFRKTLKAAIKRGNAKDVLREDRGREERS